MIKQILPFLLCLSLIFGSTGSEVFAARLIDNSRAGDVKSVEVSSEASTWEEPEENMDDSEKNSDFPGSTETEAQDEMQRMMV